jgi:hypothetical protein
MERLVLVVVAIVPVRGVMSLDRDQRLWPTLEYVDRKTAKVTPMHTSMAEASLKFSRYETGMVEAKRSRIRQTTPQ